MPNHYDFRYERIITSLIAHSPMYACPCWYLVHSTVWYAFHHSQLMPQNAYLNRNAVSRVDIQCSVNIRSRSKYGVEFSGIIFSINFSDPRNQ